MLRRQFSLVERWVAVSDEKILASRSIIEMRMRRFVLEINAYFPSESSSLPFVVDQPDKRLQTEPKKGALRWCGYRQTQSVWFVRLVI